MSWELIKANITMNGCALDMLGTGYINCSSSRGIEYYSGILIYCFGTKMYKLSSIVFFNFVAREANTRH